MRERLLVMALSLVPAGSVLASPLLYEPFNYPAGAGLSGTTEGQPTGDGGQIAPNGNQYQPTAVTGVGTAGVYSVANDVEVVSPSLATPLPVPSQGNAISYGDQGYTPRLDIRAKDPSNNPIDINSGSLYYSAAVDIADISTIPTNTNGGYFFGFNNATGSSGSQPPGAVRVYIRLDPNDSTKYQMGVNKFSNLSSSVFPTFDTVHSYSPGSVHFLVGEYTFNTGSTTDDVASLFVDPDPSTFGQVTDPSTGIVLTSNLGADIGAIQSFIFRQGNHVANQVPGVVVDELRIGTTYADVTPIPEPASLSMLALGGLGLLARRRR